MVVSITKVDSLENDKRKISSEWNNFKFSKWYQPCHSTQFWSKVVSIPKVESLENEKLLRNETTSNFQSDFDIFDDLLKKNYLKNKKTKIY